MRCANIGKRTLRLKRFDTTLQARGTIRHRRPARDESESSLKAEPNLRSSVHSLLRNTFCVLTCSYPLVR